MIAGRFQHVEKREQVVPVIFDRFRYRFSDRLEGREMDYRVDLVTAEKSLDGCGVAEIHLHEGKFAPSGNLPHPVETAPVAIRHVIGHDDVITGSDEFDGNVTADIPRTARDEYPFLHDLSSWLFLTLK